jgi:hypothetical protein
VLRCAPRQSLRGRVAVWPGYDGVCVAACDVYADARLVGRRGEGTAALRPVGAGHVASRKRAGKAVPLHTDRRAEAGLGVQTQRSRDAATCDAGAGSRSGAPGGQSQFSLALFRRVLLSFLKQKWSKCLIAKL